jgi:hypothetical protein
MTEPFNPDTLSVSDLPPDHQIPNHRVKVEDEKPSILGKLRQTTQKRSPAPPKPPKAKEPAPPYRDGMYIQPMEDFYNTIAMALMPFRPKAAAYLMFPEVVFRDGERIEGRTGARRIAEAWDAAAKKSESVRRALNSFLVVTVWGELLAAHAPLALGLMERGDGENMFSAMEDMLKKHAGTEA